MINSLGTIEMEAGNLSAARDILEKGAKKFPADIFLLQRYGTIEAKLGDVEKARELFQKSVLIQPHAPTFVAWAILEEEAGNNALTPLPRAIVETLIESDNPTSGILTLDDDIAGGKLTVDPSLMSRDARAAGKPTTSNSKLFEILFSASICNGAVREGKATICSGNGS